MIICPRCGYQAPDGSPWCPRCGFGCPYPVPYQQQPQQMPVQYQRQQITAQYDVVDALPRPDPEQQPKQKRQKKKKKLPKWLLIFIFILSAVVLFFVVFVVWAIVDSPAPDITKTPTLSNDEMMETALAQAQQQYNETSTVWALSATPTATATSTFTATPIPPTATPIPTDTPIPLPEGAQYYTVKEGENCWSIARDHGISEEELRQANGMTSCNIGIGDQIVIPAAAASQSYIAPNTNVRGAVAQDITINTCAVKGSNSGKYHCKNSPNYSTMKEYVCFSSQTEAESAGYVMSGNQGGWCQQ